VSDNPINLANVRARRRVADGRRHFIEEAGETAEEVLLELEREGLLVRTGEIRDGQPVFIAAELLNAAPAPEKMTDKERHEKLMAELTGVWPSSFSELKTSGFLNEEILHAARQVAELPAGQVDDPKWAPLIIKAAEAAEAMSEARRAILTAVLEA